MTFTVGLAERRLAERKKCCFVELILIIIIS